MPELSRAARKDRKYGEKGGCDQLEDKLKPRIDGVLLDDYQLQL